MQPSDIGAELGAPARAAATADIEGLVMAAKKVARKPARKTVAKKASAKIASKSRKPVSLPSRPKAKSPAKPAARKPARKKRPTVVEAVERDLRKLPTDLAKSALAASALQLAREMDNRGNSATSKSMCSRSLLDTLDRLRELTPPDEEKDGLDELNARRAARVGGAAA